MKINSIQNFEIPKSSQQKRIISFRAVEENSSDDDYVKISRKKYKMYKRNKILLEICTTWVALDIIRDLFHVFSNKGRPPFP